MTDFSRSMAQTRPFKVGLIGRGIQASRTPAMHIAAGQVLGFDYRYTLLDLDQMTTEPALCDLLDKAEAEGFAGLNITFPYKKQVMQHLHHLSDSARTVGAVNTVVFRDGERHGHNTDFWGFAEGMRQHLPGADMATTLLLGAGGAGGAVAHALKALGTQTLLIHDIDPKTADALAEQTGGTPVTSLEAASRAATGVVNATPMGMAKLPGTAIPPDLLRADHWVTDIVYFPLETALLRAARAKGCRTLNGGGMALFQAVRAFELFTGTKPDPAVMRARFEAFDTGLSQ
ncbi:shikimate dehydrogenase [Primorskyibacter sp. 2E107]|uniref:shikimate dehydrogenase n=1 Tax=Primorskyibacter sp. 2E107 TaxID=3403458 RepID=UPI003AF4C7A5